jgi:hypothetical protein
MCTFSFFFPTSIAVNFENDLSEFHLSEKFTCVQHYIPLIV